MFNIFRYYEDCLHLPAWYSCSPLLNCSDEQRKEIQSRLWVNTYCLGQISNQIIDELVRELFSQISEKSVPFFFTRKALLMTNAVMTNFFLYRLVRLTKLTFNLDEYPNHSCCFRIQKITKNIFRAFAFASISCVFSYYAVRITSPFSEATPALLTCAIVALEKQIFKIRPN